MPYPFKIIRMKKFVVVLIIFSSCATPKKATYVRPSVVVSIDTIAPGLYLYHMKPVGPKTPFRVLNVKDTLGLLIEEPL